jgi:hypothetical protein
MSVEWIDDNVGFINTVPIKLKVFSCKYAIKLVIEDYIRLILRNGYEYVNNIHITYPNKDFNFLNSIYPTITKEQVSTIINLINNHVETKLKEFCLDKTNDNFYFLINLNRNWNQCCVYCKTNNIIGTNTDMYNLLGFREVCVLKPCGCSVCINPCFIEMAHRKKFHKHLQYITYTYDNKTKIDRTKINVNSYTGYNCNFCNQVVTSAFRVEHLVIPDLVLEYLSNYIYELFIA